MNDPDRSVYLIVPSDQEGDQHQVDDTSVENEGISKSITKIFSRRTELEVDSKAVEAQIQSYVRIIENLASDSENAENKLSLSEVNLNLTISAKGNIGIASTSAEASMKLIFKRC